MGVSCLLHSTISAADASAVFSPARVALVVVASTTVPKSQLASSYLALVSVPAYRRLPSSFPVYHPTQLSTLTTASAATSMDLPEIEPFVKSTNLKINYINNKAHINKFYHLKQWKWIIYECLTYNALLMFYGYNPGETLTTEITKLKNIFFPQEKDLVHGTLLTISLHICNEINMLEKHVSSKIVKRFDSCTTEYKVSKILTPLINIWRILLLGPVSS